MRIKVRLLAVALIPVVAAAATWSGQYGFDRWIARPVLDYPPTIDLGDRERGEVAIGRFSITNRGRAKLVLDQFSTSCSCAGVEREIEGQWQRVESLGIPPGEQVDLAIRVGVGVPPGEKQLVQVMFSSNDMAQTTGKIEVIVPRVKGGVYPVPTAVLFGEIRVGTPARRVIDLYDNRHPSRRIEKVRSLQPERFEARLLPLDAQASAENHERGGRLLARLEITAQTSEPGPLRGAIEVSLAGEARRADLIPVFGEVVQDIECTPSTIILPRRNGERFVFSGQARLRHRDGQPIHLEVESAPPGITAKVRPLPDDDLQWLLKVEYMRADPALAGEKTIVLRLRSGALDRRLNVRVLLTTDPSSDGQREKKEGDK
jgi:hypothetical protein